MNAFLILNLDTILKVQKVDLKVLHVYIFLELHIPELSTQLHRTIFNIPTVVLYASMRQSTMCIFLVHYRYHTVIKKIYRTVVLFFFNYR